MILVSIMIIIAAFFFVGGLVKKIRGYVFGGACLLVGVTRAGWILIANTSMVFIDLAAAVLTIVGVIVLVLAIGTQIEIKKES